MQEAAEIAIERQSTEKGRDGVAELFDTVVRGGYCIGCGACAAASKSPVTIQLDEFGCYTATVDVHTSHEGPEYDLRRVCPFSDEACNEDALGQELYGSSATYNAYLGYHLATYTGYVAEGSFRESGSSGGMGKWILYELLRTDQVDAIIQVEAVSPDEADGLLYTYTVMRSADAVLCGSKSVYYPVQMAEVLQYVRDHPGRYAITGVPCFIKAVRLLAKEEPIFRERIRFCVGVICGHLKSTKYAEMIGWQFGIEPRDLASIDFRKKLPGTRANEKGVQVSSRSNEEPIAPNIVQNLFGTNYNHGFFQYKACDFCDDVVGETADISIGDAWLPEYIKDGRGTNVVVIRNEVIRKLVESAIKEGRLALQTVTAEQVIESQAGGFRQRREGLAYRLHRADLEQGWRPRKRVEANQKHIGSKRKKVYELRSRMTEESHQAYARAERTGDFSEFQHTMQPLLDAYAQLYRPGMAQRIRRSLQRKTQRLKAIFKRFSSLIG